MSVVISAAIILETYLSKSDRRIEAFVGLNNGTKREASSVLGIDISANRDHFLRRCLPHTMVEEV